MHAQREIPNIVTRPLIANMAMIIWFIRRIVVALICGRRHCNSDRMSNMGELWLLSCRLGRQQLYYRVPSLFILFFWQRYCS